MTKSKLPDPKLFEHLQWKPGMPTAQKRVGELGDQRSDGLGSPLTGETITLPNGLIVSKSPDQTFDLAQAVAYAAKQNGYLQNADLAMLVRDELDLHPFEKQDGSTDLDFSDQGQITSTLCLFHKDSAGAICMYVSDLFAMYGSDRAKQQETAEQVNKGITRPFNHELSTLLMRTSGSRNAILPKDYWPLVIPCPDLPTHQVSKAIFPTQSQRFADYLTRKGHTQASFWFIGSTPPESLNDPVQCIIRPLALGGVDFDGIGGVNANVDADGNYVDGRARAIRKKIF